MSKIDKLTPQIHEKRYLQIEKIMTFTFCSAKSRDAKFPEQNGLTVIQNFQKCSANSLPNFHNFNV